MGFKFKPQAKSNAKRFLVKTCKVEEGVVDNYLTQVDGQWGTYVDEAGQPVMAHVVRQYPSTVASEEANAAAEQQEQPQDPAPAEVSAAAEPADPMPSGASAFGAFAMAQLTAPSNAAPVEPNRPQRAGATPTAGLRIQKDRPEQNGIRRQSAGSVGDKLWALYDAAGKDVSLEQAKKLAQDAGLSPTSAAIALYNWRRFHGIASRNTK